MSPRIHRAGTGDAPAIAVMGTPPLPHFDKTLAFYEREGFAVTGGRKLKATL